MANTLSWANAAGGDWTMASDWDPATVPTSGDDVFITLPGSYTVTIGSGETGSAASITLNDSDATLETTGPLDLAGTLAVDAGTLLLDGGTIVGGTINEAGGEVVPQDGHLSGVTYQGTLDLSSITDAILYVDNSITLQGAGGTGPGTINLTGFSDSLLVDNTTTIDNATINFGMLYGEADTLANNDARGSGQTLTLGHNLTLVENGDATLETGYSNGDAVINEGDILIYGTGYDPFSFPSIVFIINGNDFTDDGSLSVDNYGELYVNTTTFTNAGSIAVPDGIFDITGSTISLGSITVDGVLTVVGPITTSQFSGVDLDGRGSFEIIGTVDNTGARLDIGASPKLNALNVHGTISGGQINVESSGDLSITGTVDATINDNGTVDTGTSNLLLQKTIAGNGSLVIGVTSTLELAAPTSVETYFDPVATLKIDTASSYTGIINNFQQTDTIDLANLNISSATINANNTLIATIATGGTQAYLLTGDFSGETVHTTSDRGAGTDLILQEAACYAEGTRIRTPLGETPIERLGPGDLVLTAGGIARPATWIGRRCIDIARHPAAERVCPIRIAPHAFGPDVPGRVLRLSPDHAMLLEGHLIPIRLLVNGMTVAYETACRAVTYFHVELESHDILIAENLPAESYLDTGNRLMFDGPSMILHPSFLGNDQARREAKSCRPFLEEAARVNVLWRALAKRAGMLDYSPPDTETATNPTCVSRLAVASSHLCASTPARMSFCSPPAAMHA